MADSKAGRACVVSVGNELLAGLVVDTNTAWLAGELTAVGVSVAEARTVGDDRAAIVEALRAACERARWVVVTGGLGPTADDLTRHAVADLLEVELELRAEVLADLEGFFARRGRPMAATNRIQAYLPAGTEALANPIGTACGIRAEWAGSVVFCLPGVPGEMRRMFAEQVRPELVRDRPGDRCVVRRRLRCYGLGESDIAAVLGDRMARGRNPRIDSTASNGIITLHIVAEAGTVEQAEAAARRDMEGIRAELGEAVFGEEDEGLAEVVGRMLAERGLTVAVAESCTGGLIGKLLTDVPGSSGYFVGGWITYSNEAKIRDLGVPAGLIASHGAVSEPVAEAMARGARQRSGADVAVAVTGIAGPTGGSAEKPVGLVYIAVADGTGCTCERYVWPFGRAGVRLRAALTAINRLRAAMRN